MDHLKFPPMIQRYITTDTKFIHEHSKFYPAKMFGEDIRDLIFWGTINQLDDILAMSDMIWWYLVSTWFVFEWKTGFLESFIVDWLSMNNEVASARGIPKYCKSWRNQTISHAASHAEMYSASAEEVAIVACFLQLQETVFDPMFIK